MLTALGRLLCELSWPVVGSGRFDPTAALIILQLRVWGRKSR
jgi:hypothetical protein